MPSIRLTQRRVDALRPRRKVRDIRDAELKGYGVRVMPSGARRYFIHSQHRGKRVWKIIDDAAAIAEPEARVRAKSMLTALREGREPDAADPGGTLFETVAEEVFDRYGRRWKPRTLDVNRAYLRRQILPFFAGRPIGEITREDVWAWFRGLHATPAAANRSAPILSVIMQQAEVWGYRPENSNPCAGIRRYRQGRSERFLRVRPSGHRSFVWHGRVQGEPVRATVGPAALMTVGDARKGALALSVGNVPRRAEGRSGAPLFRDFVLEEWLPAYRRRCAPSSCQFANRVLKRQLIPAFGRLPLDAIRRIDVERWFDAYSRTAPGGANKALEILGQIMNAALAAGHAGTAPVKGIAKNPRPKLTRFLSAEEIERLHRVLDRLVGERPSRRQQADVVRLLLLTGCRKGEILKLRWSEVDGDRLNLADTKTGVYFPPMPAVSSQCHTVPN